MGENPGDFLCRVSLLLNTAHGQCLPPPNISHRKVGETGKADLGKSAPDAEGPHRDTEEENEGSGRQEARLTLAGRGEADTKPKALRATSRGHEGQGRGELLELHSGCDSPNQSLINTSREDAVSHTYSTPFPQSTESAAGDWMSTMLALLFVI